jgi:hypothetical protein
MVDGGDIGARQRFISSYATSPSRAAVVAVLRSCRKSCHSAIIVTVKEGRITSDMPASETTEEKLMKFMALGRERMSMPRSVN